MSMVENTAAPFRSATGPSSDGGHMKGVCVIHVGALYVFILVHFYGVDFGLSCVLAAAGIVKRERERE